MEDFTINAFGKTNTFKDHGSRAKVLLEIHSHVRNGVVCYTCARPSNPLHSLQPLLSEVDVTNDNKAECTIFYHDLICLVSIENDNTRPLFIFDARSHQAQSYQFVPPIKTPDIYILIKALDCHSDSVSVAMEVASHKVKGLRLYNNRAFMCYVNVVINALISLFSVMELINSPNQHPILNAFQQLLSNSESPKDADFIRRLVGESQAEFKNSFHQDCYLFLNCLMDLCAPLKEIFQFSFKKTFTCKRCQKKTNGAEEFVTSLDITKFDSQRLEELVAQNLSMEDSIFKRCHTRECYHAEQEAHKMGERLGSDHVQVEQYQPTSKVLVIKANQIDYEKVRDCSFFSGVDDYC